MLEAFSAQSVLALSVMAFSLLSEVVRQRTLTVLSLSRATPKFIGPPCRFSLVIVSASLLGRPSFQSV